MPNGMLRALSNTNGYECTEPQCRLRIPYAILSNLDNVVDCPKCLGFYKLARAACTCGSLNLITHQILCVGETVRQWFDTNVWQKQPVIVPGPLGMTHPSVTPPTPSPAMAMGTAIHQHIAAHYRLLGTYDDWAASAPPPTKTGCCTSCGTKLSEYLDAYYGRDPREAERCAKCRR
jgi:hypothetical protein